ncbi:MAG TPA: hypothetical protein VNH45_13320 [Gaiellaceae bacterium]|jgi:hypothetical protein|nr:hypothetical protein [Gaiellaceae bacterium]
MPFEERAAQNEVLFRSVNEQIEKLGRDSDQQYVQFVCECSNGACTEQMHLTLSEYEEVRSDGRWFAIVPGHLTEQIEHVVRTTDRYLIVEKDTPEAAEIADSSDPRE